MIEQVIFYVFAGLLLSSAGMVITVRNTVFAALFLVLAFFSSAVIWLLLEAEFLSIALILVYVGAVMVLFMFVVMMLDIDMAALRAGFTKYLPIGIVVALLIALSMFLVIKSQKFPLASSSIQRHDSSYSNTTELGVALYTDYLYPFEIAGAILLVAIIVAIALTMRPGRAKKTQHADVQIGTKKADRLRILKMPVVEDASKPPPQEDTP